MSDRFVRFINNEVLPAVLNNAEIRAAYARIAFTDNPLDMAGELDVRPRPQTSWALA